MQKKEEIIVYQNPEPLLVSKQGIFPGVSLLPNNDLLIIFSIGQAFDSSDQRAFVTKSKDNGRSWSTPKQLHNHIYDKHVETDTLKPLVLQNGNLIATGYAFVRPDPLTPIVDPITFDVLPLKNKISFSNDNGESWSIPNNFNVLNKPLEISGPCIQLSSGRYVVRVDSDDYIERNYLAISKLFLDKSFLCDLSFLLLKIPAYILGCNVLTLPPRISGDFV